MNLRKSAVLFGCVFFSILGVNAGGRAETSTARVVVTVFTCVQDATSAPELKIFDINDFALVTVAPEWTLEIPAWTTTVSIPAGHYILSAHSPQCSGESEQLVGIPGQSRHVTITLNKKGVVASIDEDMYVGTVYGLLPSTTARIEIMSADSIIGEQTRHSATIDGNIYEVNHLEPGHYILRLVIGAVIATREVDLPRDVHGPIVRADLTLEDLNQLVQQQAVGSGFINVDNYLNERVETFRLGAATVDGWTTDPLPSPSDYDTGAQRISAPAASALEVTQHFLSSDARIPKELRDLSDWSLQIQRGGHDHEILVDLFPVDLKDWLRDGPKSHLNCFIAYEKHYVRLAVNDQTWRVDEIRFCP